MHNVCVHTVCKQLEELSVSYTNVIHTSVTYTCV